MPTVFYEYVAHKLPVLRLTVFFQAFGYDRGNLTSAEKMHQRYECMPSGGKCAPA
jgi:hypothetical protein